MKSEIFVNKYNAEYYSSKNNPKMVAYSKLSDKKFRDESELFLAEGVKLTREAFLNADTECAIFCAQTLEKENNGNLLAAADEAYQKGVKIILVDEQVFSKISSEKSPQGVIAIVRYMKKLHVRDDLREWQKNKRLIMLDEVRDPGNLGTIMRSAEALGIGGVILANCADLYNSKTVRAAMGTLFRLPVYFSSDAVEAICELQESNRAVYAASLSEKNLILGEYKKSPTDCIVIGNEGHGVSRNVIEASDATVMIPMAGETESLNASAAAACIMWEYYRDFK